jgi:hypothetical protein
MHVLRRSQVRIGQVDVELSAPSEARNPLSLLFSSLSLQGRCRPPTFGAPERRRPTTPDTHAIIENTRCQCFNGCLAGNNGMSSSTATAFGGLEP